MEEFLEVLKKCPLFYGIGEKELFNMLDCLGAKMEFFDKKYTIMAEGTPAKYIGIVLSGSAQIIQDDFYGNRNILSGIEPGEIFGEAFACVEAPCRVLLIDCRRILHTCTNNCGFHQLLIFNLMKDLATKVLLFHQKIEITAKRTTREKLMAYLMLQAKKSQSNYFEIPFDRQELADFLEVDRSGLSAEISKLRKEGILESYKNTFKLL